jgi:segregation and condensation protein A
MTDPHESLSESDSNQEPTLEASPQAEEEAIPSAGAGEEEHPGYIQSGYRVEQQAFTGPLDKLLELARDKDIDLFSVSLSEIADEFLQYVLSVSDPDLNELAALLVVASQLLVLKSRQLLPSETQEEEEEEVDEEALLLKRLKDYEAFKEAADLLRKAEEERRRLYIRETPPPSVGKREAVDIYEVSVFDLATAFQKVLEEIGDETPPTIQGEEYTIDEKMAELQLLLRATGELCLTLYLKGLRSRIEIIVTFLALLELMRLLRIRARQEQFFGDIWIYKQTELARDEEGDLEVAVSSDKQGFVGVEEEDFGDDFDEDEEFEDDLDDEEDNEFEDEDEEQEEDDSFGSRGNG